MLEALDRWSASAGPAAYLVLGLCALIEYVFPPFPGDTVVLLGGIYAVRGQKPWEAVLAVVTLGSVLGAAFDYGVGRYFGPRLDSSRRLGPPVRAAEARMRKSGLWLIAVNRFLPAVRGVLFIAAGASRLSFARVMALGALSALAWNSLLLLAGMALGGNAERLESWFTRYQQVAWGLLVLAALLLGGRWLWRRRKLGTA